MNEWMDEYGGRLGFRFGFDFAGKCGGGGRAERRGKERRGEERRGVFMVMCVDIYVYMRMCDGI